MRFGSVCSGIEAASVAFAPLGWEAAWLAEVDVAASQVLAYRLGATAPQHPLPGTEKAIARLKWGDRIANYGDMTVLAAMVRARQVDAPDVLVGGTPCQSFSVAGLRGGLADARGQLTMAFIDLANAIDEIRAEDGLPPVIIIWENVPGVLSHADNPLGCFLAGLAGDEDALEPGPRPEPTRSSAYWTWDKATCLHRAKWPDAGVAVGPQRAVGYRIGDAQHFGLPQRRRRIFLVGSAREGFDPAAILLEFDGLRRDSAPSRETGEGVTHAVAPCLTSSGRGVERTGDPRGQDPVVACERSSGPAGIKWPADIASTLNAHFGEKQGLEDQHVNQGCPLFVLQPVEPELYSIMPMNSGKDYKARKVEVSQPLMGSGPVGGNQGGDVLLQPIAFSCKDHGADATEDLAPTMQAMGHAGSHANAGGQLAVCVTGSVTHTLRAEGFDASEDGTGRGQPIVTCIHSDAIVRTGTALTPSPDAEGRVRLRDAGTGILSDGTAYNLTTGQPHAIATTMAVRRLMPIECHRLQGFPDDWCAVPIGNKIAADGPQYKQLGNSWAVNHARWVGRRIQAWLEREAARKNDDMADLLS